MQNSPSSEATSCSATHSIPCLLHNKSVHFYFHHSPTKAAIIMTELGKKFGIMKPSMWIQLRITSYLGGYYVHMLIIGQSDKMHRDLRNSKGSTELSATSMWILVSRDNQYVSNLVFTLYVRVLGLDTRHSKDTAS